MSDTNYDHVEWVDRSTPASIMGALVCLIGLSCLGFAPVILLSYVIQKTALEDSMSMGGQVMTAPLLVTTNISPADPFDGDFSVLTNAVVVDGVTSAVSSEVAAELAVLEAEMAASAQAQVPSVYEPEYDPFTDAGTGLLYYLLLSFFAAFLPGLFWLWCGIGSIKRRKYARKLIAAATSAWAVLGALYLIVVIVIMVALMRSMSEAFSSAGGAGAGAGMAAMGIVMVVYFIVLLMLFVVLPLMIAIFYTRRNVIITFDVYDPKPSWTDKVPVRLLAFTLPLIWLTLCGIPYSTMLFSSENPFVPANGPLLAIGWLVGSALFVGIAFYMHTLKPAGWRLMIICCLAYLAYGIVMTYSFDLSSIIDLQEEAPELAAMYAMFEPRNLVTSLCVFWGLVIAYLVSLRSVFYRPADSVPDTATPSV